MKSDDVSFPQKVLHFVAVAMHIAHSGTHSATRTIPCRVILL